MIKTHPHLYYYTRRAFSYLPHYALAVLSRDFPIGLDAGAEFWEGAYLVKQERHYD